MSALDLIHVEHLGTGRRVVMIHGGVRGGPIGGAETFAAQRSLAELGYELVLPDRPGHGRSPADGAREDLEVDALWVADLLGAGADLVGHSYGGAVALCAAALRPVATRSLTLIEAPIFSVAPEDPRVLRLAREMDSVRNETDELQTILGFARVAGIPAGVLAPRPDPGQLMAMARSLKTMRDPVTWEAGDRLDTVAAAGVPVLVVTGGWSPGFEAIADALAVRLRGRRLVIDAGHHLPQLAAVAPGGQPGSVFNEAMRSFLANAGADSG